MSRYIEVAVTLSVKLDCEKIAFTSNKRKGTDRRYMDSSAIESVRIAKLGGEYTELAAKGVTLDLGVGFQKTQVVFLEPERKAAPQPVKPASVDSFEVLANPMEGFNIGEPSPRDKFLNLCRDKGLMGESGGLPDAMIAAVKAARATMPEKAINTAVNDKLKAMGLPGLNAGELNLLKSAAK